MVSKFFHTLLWNWPWAFVLWGIFSTVFRIADLMVARPATMGGELLFMMSCGLVAAFFAGLTVFCVRYAVGRIRLRYGLPSPGSRPRK